VQKERRRSEEAKRKLGEPGSRGGYRI